MLANYPKVCSYPSMDARIEALERLARLREQNVLSEAEFEAEKARLLTEHNEGPVGEQVLSGGRFGGEQRRLIFYGLGAISISIAIGVWIVSPVEISGMYADQGSDKAVGRESKRMGQDPSVTLTPVLDFDNAAQCLPSKNLQDLFDEMSSLKPESERRFITLPAVGGTLEAKGTRVATGAAAGAVVTEISAPGSLDGLRVNGLRTVTFPGGAFYSLQVRFSDGPGPVQRVLVNQGFDLPRVGDLKAIEPESGSSVVLGIEPVDGGTALTCAKHPIITD